MRSGQYDISFSDHFPINCGAKEGRVLGPTLFGIFSLLLSYTFSQSENGLYLHTRSDGNLLLVRKRLFMDDDKLLRTCLEKVWFSHQEDQHPSSHQEDQQDHHLAIKKTSKDVGSTPCISIDDYTLWVMEDLTYLGFTISSNLSLDA